MDEKRSGKTEKIQVDKTGTKPLEKKFAWSRFYRKNVDINEICQVEAEKKFPVG